MSYKFKKNDDIYIIELKRVEENKEIVIRIIKESNLSERYCSHFKFEYLRNMTDLFKNKELIDIENIFKQLLQNNKYKLLLNKNTIKIEFKIEIPFIGQSKIVLEIHIETLNNESLLKSIITPITNSINNNISLLFDKINNLEKSNSEIIKQLNKLEENFMIKELKLKNINESLFNGNLSKIVISEEEISFLKEIVPDSNFSLLYRATIDGDAFTTFHSKCDGQGPTIVLFKTDKNRKWGAYTDYPWNSSSGCDHSKNTNYFLFSITNEKKYKPKNGVTRSNGGHNSVWFCDTIGISNKNESILAINGGIENKGNSSRYENYIKDYEITGEGTFTCVELEVYKVDKIETPK